MDAAPRSAFLAAIVLPYERTAVMGTINVVKTCAQSLGPVITGVLGHAEPLLGRVCGRGAALKATYDLGLLAVFAEKKEVKKNRAERGEEER